MWLLSLCRLFYVFFKFLQLQLCLVQGDEHAATSKEVVNDFAYQCCMWCACVDEWTDKILMSLASQTVCLPHSTIDLINDYCNFMTSWSTISMMSNDGLKVYVFLYGAVDTKTTCSEQRLSTFIVITCASGLTHRDDLIRRQILYAPWMFNLAQKSLHFDHTDLMWPMI